MDELRSALELATEDELHDLTEILFRRKFNPLDYLQGTDPDLVASPNREAWIRAVESRFRFLAADGMTVLRGQSHRVSYRYCLIRVCRHLKLKISTALKTEDIEAEIFLHLMQRNWQKIPPRDQEILLHRMGDALAKEPKQPLPLACHSDTFRLLLEGSSAIAVSSMIRSVMFHHMSRQIAFYWGSLQVSGKAVAWVPKHLLAQASRKGLTAGLARYGLARSAFAALGCALWAGFIMDLGWRTISTNYGRIIPIIFTLAQIRLTRSPQLALA